MGKHGKKLKQHLQDRGRRHCTNTANLEDDGSADALPSSAYSPELSEHGGGGADDESDGGDDESSFSSLCLDSSSKFSRYQKSVQSPKGGISYLQKFILMYVGGKMPLHLREDFCGTELLSNGGIFAVDLYGGTSSECELRLKRRFPNFAYAWEQEEFDIINRTARISLHFHLDKKQVLRHAFTYRRRLWSLPEINDCMLEVGFQSVHVWITQMPDTDNTVRSSDFNASPEVKYEEVNSFRLEDAWNAYIVAVIN